MLGLFIFSTNYEFATLYKITKYELFRSFVHVRNS